MQVDGLSFKAPSATHAEEVAIALAASHDSSKFILSDSRGACRNFELGWITTTAQAILRRACRDKDPTFRYLVWAPGHQGLPGNEAANSAARALIYRAPSVIPEDLKPDSSPLLSFKDISAKYRDEHRRYPTPLRGLGKANERTLLRLYTNTLLCPAVMKHFDPSCTGLCQYCGEVADTYHMVWACQRNPSLTPNPNPKREDWEAALLGCLDLTAQQALVQRARTAVTTNGVPE